MRAESALHAYDAFAAERASPERGRPLAKLLVGKQSEVIECWYLLIERKSMAEKSGCTQIIIIALGICLGLALFGLCG